MMAVVSVWDTASGSEMIQMDQGEMFTESVVFSPDGGKLAWYARNRVEPVHADNVVIKMHDLKKGRELFCLQIKKGLYGPVTFSPNGKCFAIGGIGGVRVWDSGTGQERFFGAHSRGLVKWSVFAPDNIHLASIDDRLLKVWNIQTGKETLTLKVNGDSAAFSPDGKFLAVGCEFGVLRVWDLERNRKVFVGRAPMDTIISIYFSPDGQRVLCGSKDSRIRIWDLQGIGLSGRRNTEHDGRAGTRPSSSGTPSTRPSPRSNPSGKRSSETEPAGHAQPARQSEQ